jgi:hypothetical protein
MIEKLVIAFGHNNNCYLMQISMHDMYYLDIEVQDSRRSIQSFLKYLQNTVKGCVDLAIAIHTL